MKLRTVILVLAGLGVPLALLTIALPITWGYGGYIERSNGVFVYVDPTGPAATIHVGERAVRPVGVEAIEEDSGNVGKQAHIEVIGKSGRARTIAVTFVPFSGALAVQERLDKILSALTAIVAFGVALLVVLRARDRRAGERAAAVLLIVGLGGLFESIALVCGNAWIATVYWIAPAAVSGAFVWAALLFLAVYPPDVTPLRRVLGRFSWIALLWGAANTFAWLYDTWTGTARLAPLERNDFVGLLLLGALVAAIIDGMISATRAYTTPMRWLGAMWLAATALAAVAPIGQIAHVSVFSSHYTDLLNAVVVFFLAFGVAYPVLRHRLIDLNILVSRASIFAIASAIIVGIFVVAEWVIGRIFEQSLGFSSQRQGLAAQALTLVVVLVLGISARSIHGFVEGRMTKTFFRKRMRGLAEIERVAREADAATDARAMMELAAITVQRGLEPLGAALYLRDGNRYEISSSTGAFEFPKGYGFNDEPVLRLRRWQEPFELDDDSTERHHVLFVPMTLRGEVLGFLCCGPKPDRTAYLGDEIAALSLLAHHVGIATAMLDRAAVPGSVALAPA